MVTAFERKDNKPLTVREVIAVLTKHVDKNLEVRMYSDAEGNSVHGLACIEVGEDGKGVWFVPMD